MARKHKKLLSTIRALGDKQEPNSAQHESEDQRMVQPQLQPQLDHFAEESGRGQHEPKTASNELMAPFLVTSVLEDQLSELATGTAETLHIAEAATPEATTPEATTPEATTPEATTPEITPQSGGAVSDEIATEEEPNESKLDTANSGESVELLDEKPQLKDEPEELEPRDPAIAEPELELKLEPEQPTEAATIPNTSSAQADTQEPEHSFTMQAGETKPEQPDYSVSDTSQAIADDSEVQAILKRPEAFALIVITFFWTIGRTFSGIWKQPG